MSYLDLATALRRAAHAHQLILYSVQAPDRLTVYRLRGSHLSPSSSSSVILHYDQADMKPILEIENFEDYSSFSAKCKLCRNAKNKARYADEEHMASQEHLDKLKEYKKIEQLTLDIIKLPVTHH